MIYACILPETLTIDEIRHSPLRVRRFDTSGRVATHEKSGIRIRVHGSESHRSMTIRPAHARCLGS